VLQELIVLLATNVMEHGHIVMILKGVQEDILPQEAPVQV